MLISAPFARAHRAMAENSLVGRLSGVGPDDLEQRPVGGDQAVGRHDGRGDHGDDEVDQGRGRQPAEQRPGVVMGWSLESPRPCCVALFEHPVVVAAYPGEPGPAGDDQLIEKPAPLADGSPLTIDNIPGRDATVRSTPTSLPRRDKERGTVEPARLPVAGRDLDLEAAVGARVVQARLDPGTDHGAFGASADQW